MKEQIFDVSHQGRVQDKLKELLTSELVPIALMQHEPVEQQTSMEEEGQLYAYVQIVCYQYCSKVQFLFIVQCHVGDWVEVLFDYSPGVCSEGGTAVVVAMCTGTITKFCYRSDMLIQFTS